MDWVEAFGSVNYWGVLVATVSTFLVGAAWYSRALFGNKWMELVGIDAESMGNPNPIIYLWTAIGSFIAAHLLAALMGVTGTTDAMGGLLFGVVLAVGLRVTTHAMHNNFAMRPPRLTVIDGLHDVVQMGVMGLIIGLMS